MVYLVLYICKTSNNFPAYFLVPKDKLTQDQRIYVNIHSSTYTLTCWESIIGPTPLHTIMGYTNNMVCSLFDTYTWHIWCYGCYHGYWNTKLVEGFWNQWCLFDMYTCSWCWKCQNNNHNTISSSSKFCMVMFRYFHVNCKNHWQLKTSNNYNMWICCMMLWSLYVCRSSSSPSLYSSNDIKL